MAWYDRFDPTTAAGMQFAGLLGGLNAMGAGLMQAGQMRPVGAPGPTFADALGAFGQGQQRGLLGAQQQAQMKRQMDRQGLLAEARSDKPDDQISPRAAAMRRALGGLPADISALADDDQLPGLAIQRATSRQRPMTPEELQAAGFRPGTVAFTNDFTGGANVGQQPDYKSPEAEAQALRIQAAGRPPPSPIILGPGQVAYDRSGRQIAAGAPDGQPLSPANAWNDILRYAPAVAAGQLDPNSPEGRRYLAAQTILTQPRPVQITQPDGSVIQVMQQPEFPFPRLAMPGAPPAGTQAPPAVPGAAPATTAPAAPGAAPAPVGVQVKPPPPLTESQGNSTMYLQRMQEAEKRLGAVVEKGYQPGGVRDRAASSVPFVGNFLMTEQGQVYRQAQEDWVRAKLRKESGAVIAESEMAAEIKTYFPQPGDSQKVIEQKAEARRTAMDALRASAGPGVDRMTNTPAPPAAPRDPLNILGTQR